MDSFESVTVLTTEERADLFSAVFGKAAHYVFNPIRTNPLGQYLTNLRIGHGRVVVLDESHFLTTDDLASGVREYVDTCTGAGDELRLVVVCSGREPGDTLLAFLATYCHVYDIICASEAIDIVSELEQLVHAPNRRSDALVYMKDQAALYRMGDEVGVVKRASAAQSSDIVIPAGMRVKITIEPIGP